MKTSLRYRARLVLLGLALIPAATLGRTPTSQPPTDPKAAPARPQAISRGMAGDEIRQRWGQPREVRPVEHEQARAEIWVFRRLIGKRTQQTAVDTEDIPMFSLNEPDNIAMMPHPVYELETIYVHQEMHLLMIEDRLEAWKEYVFERRQFGG